MNSNDEVSALIVELIERGADRRNASTSLRRTLADLRQHAAEPGLFVGDSVRVARAALIEDAPRHDAHLQEEQRKQRGRSERNRKRLLRAKTFSATCCLGFYSRSAADRTWWTTCHQCRKPLNYTADAETAAQDEPAPVRCERSESSEGLTFAAFCCGREHTYNGRTGPRRTDCPSCRSALSFRLPEAVAA